MKHDFWRCLFSEGKGTERCKKNFTRIVVTDVKRLMSANVKSLPATKSLLPMKIFKKSRASSTLFTLASSTVVPFSNINGY